MKTSENPQRFVPAIEKEFETVKQFLAIHSGIEAGYIVRKGENTTEVVATLLVRLRLMRRLLRILLKPSRCLVRLLMVDWTELRGVSVRLMRLRLSEIDPGSPR